MNPNPSKDNLEARLKAISPEVAVIVAACVIFLLKFTIRSRLLSWWDSAQFALALERYNVVQHRPHPPGYPLYILLGKLLTFLTHDPNDSFVIIGLVLSIIAAVLIFKVTYRLTGQYSAAWIGACLYTFAPLVMYHELKSLTYVISAFFSVLIAWETLLIFDGKSKNPWRIAVELGLMGMIRPFECILMLPLATWVVSRFKIKKFLLASLIFVGMQALWIIPVALMSGGFSAYFSELAAEGGKHQRNLTVLMGKPLAKIVKNWKSIYYALRQSFPFWAFFAFIPVFFRSTEKRDLKTTWFFILWLCPALILYSFNFVNYAGIPLFIMPTVAILAALGINKLTGLIESLRIKAGEGILKRKDLNHLLAVIISLHLLVIFFSVDILFFNEVYRKYDPDGFNYDRMLASDGYVYMLMEGIQDLSRDLEGDNAVILLSDLNYRVLMYYFPTHYCLWTRYLSQNHMGNDGSTKLAFNRDEEKIHLIPAEWGGQKYWVYKLQNGEKAAVFTDEMLNNIGPDQKLMILPDIEAAKAYVLDLDGAWGIYFRFGEFGVVTKEMAIMLELEKPD